MTRGLLLISHGTVDDLDDLPAFLTNIRRGHPPPKELVDEIRHRYEAIGGKSPLAAICDEVARAVGARLGVTARACQRLWRPYPGEVLEAWAREGVQSVAVVPLAQHSAKVYADAVTDAAAALAAKGGPSFTLACAANWGEEPLLTRAFAAVLREALAPLDERESARTLVAFSAHSLPVAVVRAGDPYESEVRKSAAAIVRELGPAMPDHVVCFQSQGMGTGPGGRPMEWMGPDTVSVLDQAKADGKTRVVVAPIGFLADHVEILYDLDIEAQALARERDLTLTRTASLNASPAFLDAVEAVARPLLAQLP